MNEADIVKRILQANVYDVAVETPLEDMPNLSTILGNRILLKREDLQAVFSFKLRGAYNKIQRLSPQEREKGVLAASAGNHAQGVALAAKRLGIKSVIVMPTTTPDIKVESVRAFGSDAILHGDTYDEAYAHARKLEQESGMTFIHPYDDLDVIAGQGTIAIELCRQQYQGKMDAVFVPVGGGGLLAGVLSYLKYVSPETKVIGVEPDDAPCLYQALKAGHRVELDHVGIFADGVAVRQIGKHPYDLVRDLVDDVILASSDEICAAVKDIFEDCRAITEPAGALAIAGMKKYVEQEGIRDCSLIAIASGANMNFDRLRYVAERAELGERREAVIAVTIPEHPGSFLSFCNALGNRNITEFNYRYSDDRHAHVFVGVQLRGGEVEKNELIDTLRLKSYEVVDMTENETAKLHVRYMVGGHAHSVVDECVYRFEFPERPGALLRFLTKMGQNWNISMFHYRNHGAAYGRVLVGIQVPRGDEKRFQGFLEELGYSFWNESNNPAYTLFLS